MGVGEIVRNKKGVKNGKQMNTTDKGKRAKSGGQFMIKGIPQGEGYCC